MLLYFNFDHSKGKSIFKIIYESLCRKNHFEFLLCLRCELQSHLLYEAILLCILMNSKSIVLSSGVMIDVLFDTIMHMLAVF
jgi:hypothetical protein